MYFDNESGAVFRPFFMQVVTMPTLLPLREIGILSCIAAGAIALTACAPASPPLMTGWPDSVERMLPTLLDALAPWSEADILVSESGQEQITLAPGWQAAELNEGAQLEAANPDQDRYLVVFSEPRSDLPSDTSLERFSEVTRDIVIGNLADVAVDGPTDMTEIDGQPAVQYEISGRITGETEEFNVIYLHTTVATGDRFYQILAWSDTDSFEQARSELQQITQSFQRVPDSD
jgi:hypothetical protein